MPTPPDFLVPFPNGASGVLGMHSMCDVCWEGMVGLHYGVPLLSVAVVGLHCLNSLLMTCVRACLHGEELVQEGAWGWGVMKCFAVQRLK